ncbi:MAG: hypothetical protein DHS80DRAFT_33414 [Piptocephalis tieghemiana]|nr:MAG: hypothetical protein DHS80DRAFT_33414 [Piptocephalis tieghemiana]
MPALPNVTLVLTSLLVMAGAISAAPGPVGQAASTLKAPGIEGYVLTINQGDQIGVGPAPKAETRLLNAAYVLDGLLNSDSTIIKLWHDGSDPYCLTQGTPITAKPCGNGGEGTDAQKWKVDYGEGVEGQAGWSISPKGTTKCITPVKGSPGGISLVECTEKNTIWVVDDIPYVG